MRSSVTAGIVVDVGPGWFKWNNLLGFLGRRHHSQALRPLVKRSGF
jgi:hypothetical protein